MQQHFCLDGDTNCFKTFSMQYKVFSSKSVGKLLKKKKKMVVRSKKNITVKSWTHQLRVTWFSIFRKCELIFQYIYRERERKRGINVAHATYRFEMPHIRLLHQVWTLTYLSIFPQLLQPDTALTGVMERLWFNNKSEQPSHCLQHCMKLKQRSTL